MVLQPDERPQRQPDVVPLFMYKKDVTGLAERRVGDSWPDWRSDRGRDEVQYAPVLTLVAVQLGPR